MKFGLKIFFVFIIPIVTAFGVQIRFDKVYGEEVWNRKQVISGIVDSGNYNSAKIFLNGNSSQLNIKNDFSFSAALYLENGPNEIYVQLDSSGTIFNSDTLHLKLGYKILPTVEAKAVADGFSVSLTANVLDNPKELALKFVWSEDSNNPESVLALTESDAVQLNFSSAMIPGEYYFNLYTITSEGDTSKSRTLVTLNKNGAKAFDIKKDHAKWIDKAVIYQTSVWAFVQDGKFTNVTKKIPELAELGINTIYLQPIYPTPDADQGYEVLDYYKVNSQYGTENDLRTLIKTAKSYGMHVILDFVPNHMSKNSVFGKHAVKYGTASHYYDYYQREKDNSPYASNLRVSSDGFVYYFDWSRMPNLNYDNVEIQNYILGALKHWIQDFDIDGFRFDAIWGITARSPEFTKQLRLELKRIKPEILLLAEDKASQAQVFDERFDAAYDWTASYDWVSQWSWQTVYSPFKTVFMEAPDQRSRKLRIALTNNGAGYSNNSKILRFLENNDTPRFITNHQLERTKMAAGLLFSLNGIPMMFNGQEVGNTIHPYDMWLIYSDGRTIKSYDKQGLFDYYKNLMSIRKRYKSLTSDNYEEISVSPSASAFTFRRWIDKENIFTVMNMNGSQADLKVELPLNEMTLDSNKAYYLTNLITGEVKSGTPHELSSVNISMEKYTTGIYLFADTAAVVVSVVENENEIQVPANFVLNQNYPNPFNPNTIISYSISSPGVVSLKVYDLLGREVATLINEFQSAGSYTEEFNAAKLASGVYFYRIEQNGNSISKKMTLLK
jgi:glycosidase